MEKNCEQCRWYRKKMYMTGVCDSISESLDERTLVSAGYCCAQWEPEPGEFATKGELKAIIQEAVDKTVAEMIAAMWDKKAGPADADE